MPSVARTGEPPARGYVFAGPEVRRLTAEQFADAIGAITGEWNVYPDVPAAPAGPSRRRRAAAVDAADGRRLRPRMADGVEQPDARARPSDPRSGALAARRRTRRRCRRWSWSTARSSRSGCSRGARRMLGELPPEPVSLYNRTVAGRTPAPSAFDVDVSKAATLWLVVQENGSNAPEVLQPAWAQAELVGPDGAVPLSSLTPLRRVGPARPDRGPSPVTPSDGDGRARQEPVGARLRHRRARASRGCAAPSASRTAQSEIGSTLNPQLRFFVFDAAPNMERLVPPAPEPPLPPGPHADGRRAGDRSRVLARARPRAIGRRAPRRGERAARSRARQPPLARRASRICSGP